MTIWLLAFILLASLAGLGYRQGAIKVGISFFGILAGAWLAVPLGRVLLRPIVSAVGVKDPVLQWVLPPLIMFVIISALFKALAAVVHQKADVYYKYRAGDLRLALWERLNHRVGLALGLLNGAAYFVILCFVVFAFSYWTTQLATGDEDPRSLRLLNRMGRDLQATGFNKAARAVDGMKPNFYQSADVAGLLFHNSLLEARLASYPAFLGLAEQSEFQGLARDQAFLEVRHQKRPLNELLSQPGAQPIMDNPDLLRRIWGIVNPDLTDLRAYLATGRSERYDKEPILGRWEFNVSMAASLVRQARPNIPASEMAKLRKWMTAAFENTRFVAMTDNKAILKSVPQIKLPAGGPATPPTPQTLEGQWKNLNEGRYQLTLQGADLLGIIEGDRLTIKGEGMELVFTREA